MTIKYGVGAVLIVSTLTAAHQAQRQSPTDNINSIATAWFRANTERNPESAREDTGWMAPLAAKVYDNSPAALKRWQRNSNRYCRKNIMR